MAVDPATTIPAFDTTLPTSADFVSEGDDNFRHIKTVLKTTFPNLGGAWNATQAEANYLVGVTSAIQPQISAKGAIAGQVWTGAHNYTGATITVQTLAQSTNTTGAASTAFVQTEWSTRLPNYSAPITASSVELNYSVGVTSGIQSQINAKGAISGQTWTGTQNFTGATVTVPTLSAGASGNGAASVDYANALSFASALPGQAGNAGKFITTNGSSASWSDTINGNLNFTGTARRITGDFSNATIASRTIFQTSTTNGLTSIAAIPNGTGSGSGFVANAQQDPANSSRAQLAIVPAVSASLSSDITGSGTYLPLVVNVGGSERMRFNTDGGVGIGKTADAGLKLDVSGGVQFPSGADGGYQIFKYSTVNTASRSWRFGSDLSAYGDFRLQVSTTQTGAVFANVLSIDSSTGTVTVNSGAFGYGTGAGGTVTQSTSKTTAVTINKACGRITTTTDNMAPGAFVLFTVNNTTVSNTDTVIVCLNDTAIVSENYRIECCGCASGSIKLRLTNITGVNLAEAVQINFHVAKGVTA